MSLKSFFSAGLQSLSSMAVKSGSLKTVHRYLSSHPQFKEQFLSGSCFVGGFSFDIATLGRIDQLYPLFQQLIFILLIATVFFLEARQEWVEERLPQKLRPLWKYREGFVQFLMGGLFSAFTLFYFKSASGLAVFVFVGILFFFLIFNEKKSLHRSKIPFRYIMYSLCLCSYFVYVVPIFAKSMNALIFALSMLISLAIYLLSVRWIESKQNWKQKDKLTKYILGGMVPVLFASLYYFKAIPPVPMAALEMGIYHNIEIENKNYVLHRQRPWWRFWEEGDQTFLAREGDKVYVFTRIFAPTEFKHNIFVRWKKKTKNRGWEKTDMIPISVRGGRDQGFRGYTYKEHYSPGRWRVLLLTEEGRELAYLSFKIVEDQSLDERSFHTQIR